MLFQKRIVLYKNDENVKAKYYAISTISHEIFGPYNELAKAQSHIKSLKNKQVEFTPAKYNSLPKKQKSNNENDTYAIFGIVVIAFQILIILAISVFIFYLIYLFILKIIRFIKIKRR